MLRTLSREFTDVQRLAGIAAFALLTVIAARISIPLEPVPFTMQPLAVLLAGMVLGGRDGALSQAAYVGMIALGIPVDANAVGTVALIGPTGGYLIGFVVAAGVVGLLVESAASRWWLRLLAGVVGIGVIYLFGLVVLKNVTGMDWSGTWAAGARPFLGLDLVKVAIAAGLTESARSLLLRSMTPEM